ncbi:MAG: hypothetical protein SO162_06030 [Candidatus Onthomorpha sp.]|nr:hypothetical protein [Bacteroidales bacterium]MCI7662036.1 hypothetical protein [Bacteroidales bacterium]MDY4862093.1 hypothetical protein [Candidatus Onthomorpha sp.]
MINFQFYPKNKQITHDLKSVVDVFKANVTKFESPKFTLESNEVLNHVANDLKNIGYRVETSKKSSDKILVPVLYGLNGQMEQRFDADAYNEEKGIVVEVEAGRAVTNYQFLKDLFEACVMSDVNYLVIAVRNEYRNSLDFKKVITFFNTLYTSNRLQLPLKGVLIIGY